MGPCDKPYRAEGENVSITLSKIDALTSFSVRRKKNLSFSESMAWNLSYLVVLVCSSLVLFLRVGEEHGQEEVYQTTSREDSTAILFPFPCAPVANGKTKRNCLVTCPKELAWEVVTHPLLPQGSLYKIKVNPDTDQLFLSLFPFPLASLVLQSPLKLDVTRGQWNKE